MLVVFLVIVVIKLVADQRALDYTGIAGMTSHVYTCLSLPPCPLHPLHICTEGMYMHNNSYGNMIIIQLVV